MVRLGSEGEGLRQQTVAACQSLVHIPMRGTSTYSVPCLNVSVAAGVTLFEATRQRSVAQSQRAKASRAAAEEQPESPAEPGDADGGSGDEAQAQAAEIARLRQKWKEHGASGGSER